MNKLDLSETALGIELGSTKIKAVLIDEAYRPVASGSYDWASVYENGNWTYSLEQVRTGLQSCFRDLADAVRTQYGVPLKTVGCLGVSAMMHGYLPFAKDGALLAPFRTWQNTSTQQASEALSELFSFTVPQRWSVAHLYQAILNGEPHVKKLSFLTTLAGYVHWQLTGEKVLGIGDASGMFPIDSDKNEYHGEMLRRLNEKLSPLGFPWTFRELLPRILLSGETAGRLTPEGARLLDPTGVLEPGILLCPPEGDAGTGMTATNSVAPRTGNVSAGTSIFSMVVLEKPLSGYYPEIDMVTTPAGAPAAMVHCNNCTNDMNAWCKLLGDFCGMLGHPASLDDIYPAFYKKALEGEPDCGGLVICNYLTGEPVAGVNRGRPFLLRSPDSRFTLANFCRASLYSTLTTLKLGMDILSREQVRVDRLTGHGGLFRHAGAGARFLAAAAEAPVCTMETASVGGPYGMALLAASAMQPLPLERFLRERVFADTPITRTDPKEEDIAGFRAYLDLFKAALPVNKAAAL